MNNQHQKWAITGALGYSGRYIAKMVKKAGGEVLCLTNSNGKPNPDQFDIAPLCWSDPGALAHSLEGCDVLVNTYWVRFTHGTFSHEQAIRNTKILFDAAKKAGIKRIIHTSITCPDKESDLPYFHGKADLEEYLASLGIPYTILRPAVLFGETPEESILINNMAWALRKLPVIGLFGDGRYKIQPIHVADFAQLAFNEGMRNDEDSSIIDAIGPETFTYKELFRTIGKGIGRRKPIIPLPPAIGYAAAKTLGFFMGDVMLTKDEIQGLMENRLFVENAPSVGTHRLTAWIKQHADTLGRKYSSELSRRS